MHVIPVIDLLRGRVVRALRGERALYRPIESALCGSADPLVVAARLCEHCATDTLYVADLDALQGGTVQAGAIAALLDALPRLRLWLDAGYADAAALDDARAAIDAAAGGAHGRASARVTPVLASESWRSLDALAAACAGEPQPLLSLDRRHGAALDAAGLWSAPQHWPQRLIVMSLDRVGSDGGPDLAALAAARALAPHAMLIGAGGVRDAADLEAAAAAGASAWLVASALHDRRLDAATLRRLGTVCAVPGAAPPGSHTVCRAARGTSDH